MDDVTTTAILAPSPDTSPLLPKNHNISTRVTYIKTNGKNWDITVSKRLRQYAFDAYTRMWMTKENANKLDDISQNISFAVTFLSVTATIAVAGILPLVDKVQVQWLSYLLICLGVLLNLVVAILNGYKAAYNLDQIVQIHNDKSAKYGELFRHIEDQFYLQKENRYDAKMLIDFVRERVNELDRECQSVDSQTEAKWNTHVPKDQNGDIDYDKILPLPSELRIDEDLDSNPDYVTVDVIGNNNRMTKPVRPNKVKNKVKNI